MSENDDSNNQIEDVGPVNEEKDLKSIPSKTGDRIRASIEFLGDHPLATGLMAVLGIFGLVFSVFGFGVDRIESKNTDDNVSRVEQKIDDIIEASRPVRTCDDEDVFFDVMYFARSLQEPYASWTLSGYTGHRVTVSPGICTMTLLFVTGRPTGEMTEVDITYSTAEPVSIGGVHAVKLPEDKCKRILFSSGGDDSIIGGVVIPEGQDCFYFDVETGQTVTLDVGPKRRNIAATVVDIGDARSEFKFTAMKDHYEFVVFQLFRSSSDAEYYFSLSLD